MQHAYLLLAKIMYATGDYEGALHIYADTGLDKITVFSVSDRKLQLVGEAFAIKGALNH